MSSDTTIPRVLLQTHVRTYVLVIVLTTAKTGYLTPIQGASQQEATGLVVLLSVGTPVLLPQLRGPSVQWGTHLWACKTHEMKEVEYCLD